VFCYTSNYFTWEGIQNAGKKWTMPIQNWALTLSQLAIFFEGLLDGAPDLSHHRSGAFTLTQNFEQSLPIF